VSNDCPFHLDVNHIARASDAMLRRVRETDTHARDLRPIAGDSFFNLHVRDWRQRAEDSRRQHASIDVAQVDQHRQRIGLAGHIGDGLAGFDEHRAVWTLETRGDGAQLGAHNRLAFRRRITIDVRRQRCGNCRGKANDQERSCTTTA
jgi:hypothetical protein